MISVFIHCVFLIAIPSKKPHSSPPRREIFDVDFLDKPQHLQNHNDGITESERRGEPAPPQTKQTRNTTSPLQHSAISFSPDSREATISLDAHNHHDPRFASYLSHLSSRIYAVWDYPEQAKQQNLSGNLMLRFIILHTGALKHVEILRSSGHDILDQEAIKTIHRAAPFNPLPAHLKLRRLNVLATFDYECLPVLQHVSQ
ncbi:MAG: energy transducer TonB [Desulfobacterota bacterium]|nr:energy transducer TonB [Thermodesulfobacteriota bacterium]